jgi:pyrrolidone-carboxylate peptidase
VKVDTSTDLAWKQYVANLEFAQSYQPTCVFDEQRLRPRVLVTGFGRFQSKSINATGQLVSELLSELDYPMTERPPQGQIDPPGPQTAVAHGIVSLDGVGEVDVCAMVLPVFWDLATILIAREIDAMAPDFVLMNGVAGWRQPIWMELGAFNRAKSSDDGSDILHPLEPNAVLISEAPVDDARPNLASWQAIRTAADEMLQTHAELEQDGVLLSDVLETALFAGFPRHSNTYLCNNTTYSVGYLMDHPGEVVRLMEASDTREGVDDHFAVTIERDSSTVPRLFMHWPSNLEDEHLGAGASVLRGVMAAQLMAIADGDLPTRGDNALSEL